MLLLGTLLWTFTRAIFPDGITNTMNTIKKQSNIKLGDKVRHTVTGYTGIVIARTEWLNGCWRMTVQMKVKKDGTLPEAISFDDVELEIIGKKKFKKEIGKKETGGPRPEVSRGLKVI